MTAEQQAGKPDKRRPPSVWLRLAYLVSPIPWLGFFLTLIICLRRPPDRPRAPYVDALVTAMIFSAIWLAIGMAFDDLEPVR